MRNGFTTGSCAAAAAKAATLMLLGGCEIPKIQIMTPAGVLYETEINVIERKAGLVSCSVQKDAGDDPDITNHADIVATVSIMDTKYKGVVIKGGKGVGVVTRPGLDQPVGEAAINSVPRKMITQEVNSIKEAYDFDVDLLVEIAVPQGEELAKKTFNPRLGIEGGISIIGTSGIVEPMSTKAVLDTITVSLRQKKAEGKTIAVISPGNYGVDYLKNTYDYDLDMAVKCANYIGDAVDICKELGFEKMLLVGHMGKLVKVSGGIMNTHSKIADARMELMAVAAHKAGMTPLQIDEILDCLTTEQAYATVVKAGKEKEVSSYLMERILYHLQKRAGEALAVECLMYTIDFGKIGATKMAEEWIEVAKQEEADGKC